MTDKSRKSITEIEQDEKLLESVRRQLYGIPCYPVLSSDLKELPLYFGTGPDKKPDDPCIGMITNIKVKNGGGLTAIQGDIIIDDSDEGKMIKKMINKRTPMYIQEGANND